MTGAAGGAVRASESLALSRGRSLPFGRVPLVMGILNATPDSFSDGGVNLDAERAIETGLAMAAAGAAILDIGGESTRPGSAAVDVPTELRRVLPIIEGLRRSSAICISIDTRKSEVARRALDAGADLVNDVSALRHDPKLVALIAELGVPVVLMHMRGEPATMQQEIHFDDLIGEIKAELSERIEAGVKAGIAREQIVIDPGIGFGKTFEQNLEILARAAEFRELGPLLIGASRKAFVGHLTGRPAGRERAAGSLAAVAAAYRAGAKIVRVHDVAETVDFLKVFHALSERTA